MLAKSREDADQCLLLSPVNGLDHVTLVGREEEEAATLRLGEFVLYGREARSTEAFRSYDILLYVSERYMSPTMQRTRISDAMSSSTALIEVLYSSVVMP